MSNYRKYKELPKGWINYIPKDGEEPPEAPKWSGEKEPPPVGAKINVRINGVGPGIVKGYFVEYGWLGVLHDVLDPPAWWIKQNVVDGKKPLGHAFGVEIEY